MYRQSEVNSGPLAAETGSGVWDTPAHFNEFRVLASLLHRRRSTEVNQTLQDVGPSPGLLHYICIFGGSCPSQNSGRWKIHFASKSCVLILAALLDGILVQRPSAKRQILWHGTRNGITEFSQRAPPIFGWEAITF